MGILKHPWKKGEIPLEPRQKMYIKLTDERLQDLIDTYRDSDPVSQGHSFTIFLALRELQRLREERIAYE